MLVRQNTVFLIIPCCGKKGSVVYIHEHQSSRENVALFEFYLVGMKGKKTVTFVQYGLRSGRHVTTWLNV